MNDFFSAIQAHLEDKLDLDVSGSTNSKIVSLGVDKVIFIKESHSEEGERIALEEDHNYSLLAINREASLLYLGGTQNHITQYNMQTKQYDKLFDTMGSINSIKCSPACKYLAVAEASPKAIVFDTETGKIEKCRPGHTGSVFDVFFSFDEKYVGSIGADQTVLIHYLDPNDQPQEMARYSITQMQDCTQLKGSFHPSQHTVFLPGQRQLQKYTLLNKKWQHSKFPNINHPESIIVSECINDSFLATSTTKQTFIWNFIKEEKIYQIDINMVKIVSFNDSFCGVRDDGRVYQFRRNLEAAAERKEEPMEIEEDRLEFDVNEEEDMEVEDNEEQSKQIMYVQAKKSKADRIITSYPQTYIANCTKYFEESRFLFTNSQGYIIQRKQTEMDLSIQFQQTNSQKTLLFKDTDMSLFDINKLVILYANDNKFGIKSRKAAYYENWEKGWTDIQGVALGVNWLAVANTEEIKLFDYLGLQIKSIGFDRELVAIRAYQNLLIAIYHESVPLYGSQNLSMELFIVNPSDAKLISNCHVPTRKGSFLRWIGFSEQGMLFSQDSHGIIRCFSLETNQWTTLDVIGVEQTRKIWLIYIKNYQLYYWKTSDSDPEPTVSPRFETKCSKLTIAVINQQQFPNNSCYSEMLFNRYVLDHEKARIRLWYHLKNSRGEGNDHFSEQSSSIINSVQLANRHKQLDRKLIPIIEHYINNKQDLKALMIAKSLVRTIEIEKEIIDFIDTFNKRSESIELEAHWEERVKETEYQQMQELDLKDLRGKVERSIEIRNSKRVDPMSQRNKKPLDSIPSFSQNISQSINMDLSSQKLNNSQVSINSSEPDEIENPFMKKQHSHEQMEAKKKEISEQVEKYGFKKKAEVRKGMK